MSARALIPPPNGAGDGGLAAFIRGPRHDRPGDAGGAAWRVVATEAG